MQKENIDLMNVEYEDVLHLYRGWRRSETALKDKNKELGALKSRISQLHESHDKFRNQINALESVKELTISLQNQLSALQHENKQLLEENKELAELSARAESLLQEKVANERQQSAAIKDIQLEFATLRGRYEETLVSQRALENLAADEQAMRVAAEARLQTADETLSASREETRSLRQRLETTTLRLSQCDHELLHASEHLTSLSQEVSHISVTKHQMSSLEAEIGVLKGDIARLLRLLEHSPATKAFLAHWQDSGGMDFVGISRDSKVQESFQSFEGSGDPQDWNAFDLTPTEFAHLKRVHGGDPFPMTATLNEESEFWVPSDAAKLGLQFISAKAPHASPSVIMDFLRSMNKIWLKRERRRIKRVKQVYSSRVEDLKRQLANAKPYKGVIAERQIKILKTQVKDERIKTLTGRPRRSLESGPYDLETFDELDREDSELFDRPPHERRLCKLVQRANNHQTASVSQVSSEKLLEASLHSLETMGRRMHITGGSSMGGAGGDSRGNISMNMSRYVDEDELDGRFSAAGDAGKYPNDSYLRGALWLGRNLTMVSEELADAMDSFRTKYLLEVSAASQDTDARRSAHRLSLLASSGLTEAHSLASRSRQKTREILQGASAIVPGDTRAYHAFLQTLPIESTLSSAPAGGTGSDSVNGHTHKRTSSPSRVHDFNNSLRRSRSPF